LHVFVVASQKRCITRGSASEAWSHGDVALYMADEHALFLRGAVR